MNIINTTSISVGGVDVQIDRKEIKNLHIGVYPPHGRVRVATPVKIDDEAVRLAVVSKLSWIKKQVRHFQEQPRQTKREMVSGESHYFLGKRYLLDVIHGSAKHHVVLKHSHLELHVRANTSVDNRKLVLSEWYREQLQNKALYLILKWEKIIGVELSSWSIKKMRTKWGSCNIKNKRVFLNLDLAKNSVECIEYIVVHELLHLLERHHNDNFRNLLNYYLPNWKESRDNLNNSILE